MKRITEGLSPQQISDLVRDGNALTLHTTPADDNDTGSGVESPPQQELEGKNQNQTPQPAKEIHTSQSDVPNEFNDRQGAETREEELIDKTSSVVKLLEWLKMHPGDWGHVLNMYKLRGADFSDERINASNIPEILMKVEEAFPGFTQRLLKELEEFQPDPVKLILGGSDYWMK
jgi:hypothetical protein